MKKPSRPVVVIFAVALLTVMGCDDGYPNVSGMITVDEQPIANVRVVFSPQTVGDNHTPGPWSMGVTDESGRYTLRTRRDESGAVAGPHKVGFEWSDVDFDQMSNLKAERLTAQDKEAVVSEIKKLNNKIASRPKIDEDISLDFQVPIEGTSSANFEIAK